MKKRKSEPRNNEKLFKGLFDNISSGVAIYEPVEDGEDFVIKDLNKAGERVSRTSRDEVVGKRVTEVFPGIQDIGLLDVFRRVNRTGKPESLPLTLYQDDRITEWVENYVFRLDSGEIIAIYNDLTDQRRAESALRESEEKFRLISEQSMLGIIILQDNSIKYANQALADIVELPVEELLERPQNELIGAFVHPEDRDLVAEQAAKKTTGGTEGIMTHYTYRLILPDKTLKWVEQYSKTVSFEGKPADLISMVDITGHKLLEQQMFQAQKMESIGLLAGGIAHDFNNLLTAILGNADLALTEIQPGSMLYEDIREIKDTSERAAGLTRKLLAFSRRQIAEQKVVDLNRTLEEMHRMLKRIIGEKITLETVRGENLWLVKIDPGQIEQVVTNLVINAKDAVTDRGTITVETANVELDEEYTNTHAGVIPGEYVMLAVSDTGIGMDEYVKAHLFEPFFTTKEKDKGTGLGLSTCYGIVKQNKGSIWVYSEPGRGTTVKVYFPRETEAEAPTVQEQSPPKVLTGTETILVAEDEPTVREIIIRVLSESGYWVLEAHNGEEALRISATVREDIHLLITDVVMPTIGGREVAEQLKRRHPAMKVLYISGYTDNSIVHQGFLEEGLRFLQKPFTPQRILEKVRQVLEEAKE